MSRKLFYIPFVVILICCLEVLMRMYFGFCDTVLLQEDSDFEYIAQPNQDRFRFRNKIRYNSYGMRSAEVDTAATIILGFGDSVLNGGVQTDQDDLATEILSDSLSKLYPNKVQFLNISAGSWGPDNCFAYLNKFGDFKAEALFLFVSSHDAYDTMSFDKIIDVHVGYPSKQYSFALYELLDRYVIPRFKNYMIKGKTKDNELGINKQLPASVFNPGFSSFVSFSKINGIPLIIYLHADKAELVHGRYNQQGREIIMFAKANDVPIILALENGLGKSDFRDFIHLNKQGQYKLANSILDFINKSDG